MKIKIEIKDGKVYADFIGYKGRTCEVDARKLLKALQSNFEVKANMKRKEGQEDTGVLA